MCINVDILEWCNPEGRDVCVPVRHFVHEESEEHSPEAVKHGGHGAHGGEETVFVCQLAQAKGLS